MSCISIQSVPCTQKPKKQMQICLPGRELNPGHLRDRQVYLPLYYRGMTLISGFLTNYITLPSSSAKPETDRTWRFVRFPALQECVSCIFSGWTALQHSLPAIPLFKLSSTRLIPPSPFSIGSAAFSACPAQKYRYTRLPSLSIPVP